MTKPKWGPEGKPLMPVTIRGVTYPSVKAAAKALKVKPGTIYCALSKGRVDQIGLGPKNPKSRRVPYIPPKPVTVAGKDFPSLQALSLYLGRAKAYASNKLKRRPNGMAELVQEVMAKGMEEQAAATRQAFRELDRRMSAGLEHRY